MHLHNIIFFFQKKNQEESYYNKFDKISKNVNKNLLYSLLMETRASMYMCIDLLTIIKSIIKN